MLPYDTLLTFGAGVLFCGWMLWDLRKENKKAEARKQAALAAAASFGPPAPPIRVATAPRLPSAPPVVVRPPRPSGGAPRMPTLPSAVHMTDVRKLAWDDMAVEELTPQIGRRLIYSQQQMLAHVYLKQGAIVPAHDHVNEQFTYVLSGALRFWIGEHADNPGSTYVDVRAGEVLVIPSHVRHRAEALEDTLDVDIFNPPRQDWIDKSDDYLRTGTPMGNVPGGPASQGDGDGGNG
ncbi:MAG: cupin domain-containing protein [Gemmatimonas sp.]|jgi:quercetin dioxygenase-like cupin family protein